MFDIGWDEMLLTAIVAIIVIGPKDLPMALRTAGRWVGKVRRVSGYFRSGIETMIRDAELEEMERRWKEQNAAIMTAHPLGASAEAALVGQNPGTDLVTDRGAGTDFPVGTGFAPANPPDPAQTSASPAAAAPRRAKRSSGKPAAKSKAKSATKPRQTRTNPADGR